MNETLENQLSETKSRKMKFLHITFHKGCLLDIEYMFHQLGHELTSMYFDDGETSPTDPERYKLTHERCSKSWNKYSEYYNSFDGIITSDTCPLSRIFLQNNWKKILIVWVCNRFDYSIANEQKDPEFYNLLRDIPNRPNVFIFGNTMIENIYSQNYKNVNISNFVIKPNGKHLLTKELHKTYETGENKLIISPYHNETKMMNLSEKLNSLNIPNFCYSWQDDFHISSLLKYKAFICIPYAFSTIALFERMQLGMITFIPSVNFLIELFYSYGFTNSWFQPPFHPSNLKLLTFSEWYLEENKDLFVFFDSWEDLKMKFENTNYEEKTKQILEFAKRHENIQLQKWNNVIQELVRRCNS